MTETPLARAIREEREAAGRVRDWFAGVTTPAPLEQLDADLDRARAATDEAVRKVEALVLTRDEAREILRRIASGRVTDGSDRLLQPALEKVRRIARDESVGGWWPDHGFRNPREVPPHRSGGGLPGRYLGGCNCADRTPTVPVYRDVMTHLDDCPAKGSGYPVGAFYTTPAPTAQGDTTGGRDE